MPIEFVQRHLYSLFASIPAYGMQLITDTPDPLPPGLPATPSFRHWRLPSWFPQKVLINRAIVCYESAGYIQARDWLTIPPGGGTAADYCRHFMMAGNWWTSRTNMETTLWIDPGGLRFSTANPPGSENSDFSGTTFIMHEFTPNPMMNYDTGDLRYPIAFDRSAGDKMATLQCGTSQKGASAKYASKLTCTYGSIAKHRP